MEPTDGQNTGPTAARAETRPGTSPAVATEVEPSAPISTVGSTSPASTSSTVTMRLPVPRSPAASTAAVPTSTSPVGQQLEPVHEKASVLDVGDDENPGKCSVLVPALAKRGKGLGVPEISSQLY